MMSKAELRAYVLQHPDDEEAFYELSDRIKANAKSVTLEELELELSKQINSQH
ncbi:hypothetical protein [Scytonema sp. UIC 10036]|uniref:DUF6887 family protein n=1 Tax=Scytonema sp. UIC 10036 TaxID=2304196 RepID=UPI001FAB1FC8|nr:hypothetical protein [Scytonema sp. UIC 10036]